MLTRAAKKNLLSNLSDIVHFMLINNIKNICMKVPFRLHDCKDIFDKVKIYFSRLH